MLFIIAMCLKAFVQCAVCFDPYCFEALVDGEIMEVDNPDEPDGPSFFQLTTYVAKEKQAHKKHFS
jgi:hypothetical protein